MRDFLPAGVLKLGGDGFAGGHVIEKRNLAGRLRFSDRCYACYA